MAYVSTDELASFLRIADTNDHGHLSALISSAMEAVAAFCGHRFDDADSSATPRLFRAERRDVLPVDPIAVSTDLVVETDSGGDGTFDTTWSASDYQLEPLNQRASGMANHPYTVIRAVDARWFPVDRQARARVTARWGWSTVPASVRDATMLHAARLHERRNAPAGLVAGDGFIGRTSLGIDPDVATLLYPFVRADKWT